MDHGNVLKDIISSKRFTTITLNKIFRQAAKSKIILYSHKVNEGINFLIPEEQEKTIEVSAREKEQIENIEREDIEENIETENIKKSLENQTQNKEKLKEENLVNDFFFIPENNQLKILETIISLCTGRLQKYGNYDFIKNIQIISPTKKGTLGTKELNKSLQQAINPPSEEKRERKFLDSTFREGDRIMQIKNNYDIYWEKREPTLEMGKGVFNGEYGTILSIDETEKKVKIEFDDNKLVWYNFEELEQIEHSYCITVHKAQRK